MKNNPTSTNIGKMGVSELDVNITDAFGQLMDFNGVEHEFQMTFEAFDIGTMENKPPVPNYQGAAIRNKFSSLHSGVKARHNAPHANPTSKSKPTAVSFQSKAIA